MKSEDYDQLFTHKRFVGRCVHTKYLFDEKLNIVECATCGKEMNPMFVIKQFVNKENGYLMRLKRLEKQAEKAVKKNRCKCRHCGRMTPIQIER